MKSDFMNIDEPMGKKTRSASPKISIIVPVYNAEVWLPRCVDSLIGQSYKNLEIILVDDGSTDGSLRICQNYAAEDRRVVVVHKDNGGASSARNAGLDICTGDYVGFIDSDDYAHPQMYEALLYALTAFGQDMGMVEFKFVKPFLKALSTEEILQKTRILTQVEAFGIMFGTSGLSFKALSVTTKLYSHKLIGNKRFSKDLTIGEDMDFNIRCFLDSRSLAFVDFPLMNYFGRDDSLTTRECAADGAGNTVRAFTSAAKYFTKRDINQGLYLFKGYKQVLNLRYLDRGGRTRLRLKNLCGKYHHIRFSVQKCHLRKRWRCLYATTRRLSIV